MNSTVTMILIKEKPLLRALWTPDLPGSPYTCGGNQAGYSPPPPVINLANPPGNSLCRDNFSDCLEGKVIHL